MKTSSSHFLIIAEDFSISLLFLKCIIPYYADSNKDLMNEIKMKLELQNKEKVIEGQDTHNNHTLKLESPLHIKTKYYNASTSVLMTTYDHVLHTNPKEFAKDIIETKNLNVDSIFFLITASSPQKFHGHDSYCKVSSELIPALNPQIQTAIYQKSNDLEVDINYIMKKEEELDNFTESIFDDFISISRVDEIIHPKAVSMLEETEGITRVIDILESIIWTGSEMISKEKKVQGDKQESLKVNIHVPTFEKNKDLRAKYEKEEAYNQQIDNVVEQKNIEKQKEQILNKDEQKEIVEKQEKKVLEKVEDQSSLMKDKNTVDKVKENQTQVKKQNEQSLLEEDEDFQESSINDFVKILHQIKNIKEISTTLSDSERKDKAEKFVLNMLAQLGMEDSDEES